jgi:hypothetical protein
MEHFVKEDSIVREIWGKSETIIFIFAGASAEFALNKAVDWLFYTGKLPADPLGRLFSTVAYAQDIVFSDTAAALQKIDKINSVHRQVEHNRNANIPEWAYRDVLYMLIDYSIRAYELLERPLRLEEKKEAFDVFYRVGRQMNLKDLPPDFDAWTADRQKHMENDLVHSEFSKQLFEQYKKHLGSIRYELLLEAQKLVVPTQVRMLMKWTSIPLLKPALLIYKIIGEGKIQEFIKSLVLPDAYKSEIAALDIVKEEKHKSQ